MSIFQFLQSVCQKYHLGKLKHWSIIPFGLINTKYLIKTIGGKFVVRLSARSRKELAFEVALLSRVKSLQVPQLMPYEQGHFISLYNGRPYFVYKYIEGKTPSKITTSIIRQLGYFQAIFHLLGKGFKARIKRVLYYHFPKQKIQAYHRAICHKIPKEFRRQYDVVRQVLLAIDVPKNLPSGPIHVDIKPENVLVNKGKVTGILDFDNAYIGPYMVDIGKTIFWFCVKHGRLNKQLVNQFIKSYERKRRLSPIERKFLNNAVSYAIASHIYVDFYRYCHDKTTPYKYLKMLLKEFYPVLLKNKLCH